MAGCIPLSSSSVGARVYRWFDERLGLGALLSYKVPAHANRIWYMLGGTTVALVILQGITGFLLAQFYHAHPETPGAYESLQYIIAEAPLGWFIRGLHYWGAQVTVVLVSLHLLRVFVTGSFKKPRELNWLAGVGLLALLVAFMFSGTVLKWDQEGYEALVHNIEIGELLGTLGYFFSPEFASHIPILTRLYVAHVSILPILAILLFGLHAYLIRKHGIS